MINYFSGIFFKGIIKSLIVWFVWMYYGWPFNMRKAFLQYASQHVFFISNTFKSNTRLRLTKNQANAKHHPEAELLTSENHWHSSTTLSSNNNKQKNKHVCIHEIMQLAIMKMKTKMKTDSPKYGINRPRCRHGHKYSKYMKHLSTMTLICIKQHLSNIWSSVYGNVKHHWGWVEKALLIKKPCS